MRLGWRKLIPGGDPPIYQDPFMLRWRGSKEGHVNVELLRQSGGNADVRYSKAPTSLDLDIVRTRSNADTVAL
jgi:hypothetical protein